MSKGKTRRNTARARSTAPVSYTHLINREKIDAIREAVKELEKAGYIVRSRERDEKGRLRGADVYKRQNLFGDAAIGEYFRVFISYGVIALALVLHAWRGHSAKRDLRALSEKE